MLEKHEPTGAYVVRAEAEIPYQIALGDAWRTFFVSLKAGKITGSICNGPKCGGRVYVPVRSYCPRCFIDIDNQVNVSDHGELRGWAVTNFRFFGMPVDPPFITAAIRLDGSDVDFLHMLGNVDASDVQTLETTLRPGTRVRAIWSEHRTGSIMDIAHFEPVS